MPCKNIVIANVYNINKFRTVFVCFMFCVSQWFVFIFNWRL